MSMRDVQFQELEQQGYQNSWFDLIRASLSTPTTTLNQQQEPLIIQSSCQSCSPTPALPKATFILSIGLVFASVIGLFLCEVGALNNEFPIKNINVGSEKCEFEFGDLFDGAGFDNGYYYLHPTPSPSTVLKFNGIETALYKNDILTGVLGVNDKEIMVGQLCAR